MVKSNCTEQTAVTDNIDCILSMLISVTPFSLKAVEID